MPKFAPGTVVRVVRDLEAEWIEEHYERKVFPFRWLNRTGIVVGRDEDDAGKTIYVVEFEDESHKTERTYFYADELKQEVDQRVLVVTTGEDWSERDGHETNGREKDDHFHGRQGDRHDGYQHGTVQEGGRERCVNRCAN